MTRAALYFRQSLDVQEGIDRQRDRCRSLASAKGWEIVEEYADNDTSATKARGAATAWGRMLADARAGKFDVVIAVDLDRLLRTVRDLLTLTETGTKVLTVDGEIDLTTADGEFRATMLAGIARFEARRKGERQLRANEKRANEGKRTGGRRPFGYETDGLTIDPREADAVREGFRLFLSGVPLAEIARVWNSKGLVTAQKRYKGEHKGEPSPWAAYSVRMVLTNPRYMGKRQYHGEIVGDAAWDAIVPESTWRAANAILANPERRRTPTRGKYLLTGLAACGVCGAPVHAGGNARKGVPAYRCSGSLGHFARRSEPIDEFVQQYVVEKLSMPDAVALTSRKGADTGALDLEAVGIRERLDSLALDFANDTLTASQLRVATEKLRARLNEIEAQLADAGKVNVLSPLIGGDVQASWDALPTANKRAVIALLYRVEIRPIGKGRRHFDPESVTVTPQT